MITAPGFLAAYREDRDEEAGEDERERRLPSLAAGDPLTLRSLEAEGHETQPPARYTEASLVKALEERGIGRPSTYASIMSTILERGYVWKRGTALVPSWIAFAVITLLERHFGELVDYDFTARMEEVLDAVAGGDGDRLAALGGFYYGDAERDFRGLHPMVSGLGDIDARDINSLPIGDGVVLRVGRYGPYVERGNGEGVERGNVPDDIAPDELTLDKALELLAQPSGDRMLGEDPETGRADRRQVGSLRAVRHRGAARGRTQVREASHRVVVLNDVARDGDARGRAAAADPAAGRRCRPRDR